MLQALSENTYTMDNLKIFDFSGGFGGYTNPLQDVEVIKDSFHLYKGDASKKAVSGLEEIPLDMEQDLQFEDEDGKFKNFTCYIGDFEPGEAKTLTYQVRVHDSLYLNNNGSFTLYNRATVYEDDTKNTIVPSPNQGQIQAYLSDDKISYGKWERKYSGIRQEEEKTVTMDENVYEITDSSVTAVDTPSAFTVPEGSYEYHVIVNEAGLLDVNSVTMVDLLGDKMQYTGYVRVDAYESLDQQNLDGSTLGELSGTIVRTAWLKIDNSSSFAFTPAQLGFSGNNAYSLDYFTKIVGVPESTYVDVNNSFTMYGTVIGNGSYSLVNGAIRVSVSMQAMSASGFQAEKSGWYYERPLADTGSQWSKGTLYWYIKATGTNIPANIVLKDQLEGSGHQFVTSDSFVGIYVGSEAIPSSLEELTGSEISSDLYEVGWESSAVTVKFLQSVTIPENQAIYIVIKTAVTDKPAQNQTRTYQNSFWQKSGDGDFAKVNTASQTVLGGNAGAKTLQGAFIYDGTKYWNAENTSQIYARSTANHLKTTDGKSERLEPGTYIEYLVDISRGGILTGDITVSDILPEGLEIAFVRNAWFNNCTADNVEIEGLDETQWQMYTETDKPGANVKTDCIYYYNSETREVRWKMANVAVTNANASVENKFLRFQLVCKVVDSDVLLGVESKSFTNSITIIQDNQVIERDTAGTVTLSRSTISKEINGTQNGNIIPFKLVVNELSEDLLEDRDTVVLVDELSSSMTLDLSSIQVIDKTGKILTDIPMAVETEDNKTCLKLTLPDDEKLTIIYEAVVNALPNKKVSISNVAHWEGYDAAPGSVVENKSFSYSVDGMAEVIGYASLKLVKRDAQNIQKKLAGATFTMQEAILNEDGSRTLTGEVHTATTDENGELVFSTEEENWWMQFDTLYCLTEIEAPAGYVCDTTPKYIVLAKKSNMTEYPEDVLVRRNMLQFVYEATNDRIDYELPQTGGNGNLFYTFCGFFLIITSVFLLYMQKEKKS
jgi:LPXTG-motif cell wall-anchored protein